MIGFNALGRMGRLANQMFQYASLKGIATHHGYDYMIAYHPDAVDDGIGNMLRTELFDSFDLKVRTGLFNAPTLSERVHNFDQQFFDECPDNVTLQGYFQTEKYFKHIEDEIREDFTFKDDILAPCKEMIEDVENPVALHVRRTDYVINSANHPPCTLDYYKKALSHFEAHRNVIVFSDDPAWCNEQELFSGEHFMISENEDNRIDLCLMSLCDDFIIANSTFSWWGAWLSANVDKKVIAPRQWFGAEGYTKSHNTKDVTPDGWTRI